jgi:hypothetical protein
VVGAITEAHGAMSTDAAALQLVEASQLLGFTDIDSASEPIALVIGSMAGGTGAGALLDVCDVLRSKGERAAKQLAYMTQPFAVLYTSDIFKGVGGVPGAEPNSLAVMAELTAGLRAAQAGETTPSYHQTAGLGVPLSERGPALTFLMGAGNDTMSLGDPTAVYRSTGLAISTWVTDEKVQKGLARSPIGNCHEERSTGSKLPIHSKVDPIGSVIQPFSSFGYARLEVSRRRFADYAAERLARHVVDHLLRAHLKGVDGGPADAALEARVNPQSVTRFLQGCELSERDRTENQIIDAIENAAHGPAADAGIPNGGDLRAACETSGADLAHRALQTGPGAVDLTAAQNRLVSQCHARVTELKPVWSQMLKIGADRWCDEIQPVVVRHVTRTLSEEGLPVTVSLLEHAEDDLDAAIAQLDSEAVQARNYGRNAFGHMSFPTGGAAGKAVANAIQNEFAKAASNCLRSEVEALLRERAMSAIRDFKREFLVPLRRSLAAEAVALNDAWPDIQGWASATTLPSSFFPDPNVVLLTDLDRYPSMFDDLLGQSLGGSPARAVQSAIERVIESSSDDGAAGPLVGNQIAPFIGFDSWRPGSSTPAVFQVGASPDALRQRCGRWLLADTSSGIGAYLTEPLEERLSNASNDEVDIFVSRLRRALDLSMPFVEISPAVFAEVADRAKPEISRTLSAIPLSVAPGQYAYDRIADMLKSVIAESKDDSPGSPSPHIEEFFRSGGATSGSVDIEISTFMRGYHPMVFSSLVTPIASAARERIGGGDHAFWMMRRARPLLQFVPLTTLQIEALVRGWYAGRLLGLIRFEALQKHGQASTIATISRGASGFVPLPGMILGRLPVTAPDVFASVLESYPLAEVLHAAGDPGALLPYERLFELGDCTELNQWIQSGEVPFGSSLGGDDPESRRAELLTALDDAKQGNLTVKNSYEPRADEWSQPPMTWELVELLNKVIDQLTESIKAVPSDKGGFVGG